MRKTENDATRAMKLVVLPGDGVGPEVVREAVKVLRVVEKKFGVSFDMKELPCGGKHYLESGEEWPAGTFELCRDWADAILLGAVGHPGARLPNGDLAGAGVIFGLRFGLDLYANVRPCKLYPGVPHKVHDKFTQVWAPDMVDMVILRENTEGEYVPTRGFLKRAGETELAVDSRVVTRKGTLRLMKYAFDLAARRHGTPGEGIKRVTCIDKSNVLAGCQLFRAIYDEVAAGYPNIQKDYAYVDAFMQYLVRTPEMYDVAVAPNMMGDIATDLAAVLQGGMGVAASANLGDEHGMFEGVHGSAPNIAGQNIANPVATILAARMMLGWLADRSGRDDLRRAGDAIEGAVARALADPANHTGDLGGRAKTDQLGDAIVRELEEGAP